MLKLMLVDDEKQTQEGLCAFIRNQKYPLHIIGVYSDAKAAYAHIRREKPDILITDVVMPGMRGTEFIRQLRQEFDDLQILMISGYQNIAFIKQGLKCDICDFLLKPIDLQELDEALQKSMNLAARTASYRQSTRQLDSMAQPLRPELQSIVEFLNQHYPEHITLHSLSQEIYLSPSYISTLFKKETGQAFSDFLAQLRVEKAKQLLRGSCLRIAEIAQQVGYDDAAYFGRVFRRYCGVTPFDYRAGEPAAGTKGDAAQ